MKRLLFCAVLGMTTTLGHAVMPRDAFNDSPRVSETPPIAQLDFTHLPIGATPRALETLVVNGRGTATWRIDGDPQDATRPHRLLYGTKNEDEPSDGSDFSFDDQKPAGERLTWSMALFKDVSVAEGDLTVSFNTAAGADSRVALVYRYIDPATFYLFDCDANGGFFTLYRVQKGKWKVVNRISGIVSAGIWHKVRLIFQNTVYQAFFDNELALGGQDKNLTSAGRLGLALPVEDNASFREMVLRSPPLAPTPSKPAH